MTTTDILKKMKKRIAILLTAGLALSSNARQISPEEAISSAKAFIQKEMITSSGFNLRGAADQMKVAYTATADGLNCFYIVNDESGFMILSADTRLPEVLGWSDAGPYDEKKVSESLKWWLSEYQNEIAAALPKMSENVSGTTLHRAADNKTIAPILTTQWNQTAPYNNDCPMDQYYTSARTVTGCVATAMAQVMKHHNWPKNPTGSNAGVIFTGTTLDWANMIDNYETTKYTAREAAAVAQLMRQCGASVNMQYSAWASGAYNNDVQYALRTYFGYASDLEMHWKDYTMMKEWDALVYGELAAGRPLYYAGQSSEGGHAFVCDGYRGNGYYHFNWGWGGYQDGYFRLTALNPESGGAGSYEGGYNSTQTIITGVRPSNGETATQSALTSTGAFIYDDETGEFRITDSIFGDYELIYNPLSYAETVSIGIKAVNPDKHDAEPTYFMVEQNYTINSGYGFTNLTANVKGLSDGEWHLSPAFIAKGEENWQDILVPLGKQSYVTLKVAGNKYTYSNGGTDANMSANLIIGTPQHIGKIYANAEKSIRIPVLNVGKGDFLGEIGLSLFPDDEYGDVISINKSVSIPGDSFAQLDFTSPDIVATGRYQLFINDEDGNTLNNTTYYTLEDGDFATPDWSNLIAGELSPNFVTQGDEKMLYVSVSNNTSRPVDVTIKFVFKDADSGKMVRELTAINPNTYQAGRQARSAFGPVAIDLTPGRYLWHVEDTDGNILSYPACMTVESPLLSKDGLTYIITDESKKEAALTAPEGEPYSGNLVVPASLDGYKITTIRQDALAFATATDITLPESITWLENGALYNASRLQHLTMLSPTTVKHGTPLVADGRASKIWIGTPDGCANAYRWSGFWGAYRFPFWTLNPEENTSFADLDIDPATGKIYSPYYVSPTEKLKFGANVPTGMNVMVTTVVDGEWTFKIINPLTETFEAPALGWQGGRLILTATTADSGVETIRNSDNATDDNIYTIDGLKISDDKHLKPGIYIQNGNKILVK